MSFFGLYIGAERLRGLDESAYLVVWFSRATLLMLPSTMVRLDDGTPVAWAFMGELGQYWDIAPRLTPSGLDGTIITLHVEVSVAVVWLA